MEKNNYLKNENANIRSDFNLLFSLIKDLFIYFILLAPRIIGLIFYTLINDSHKRANFFENIFLEPFKIIMKINNWFFEAKYTAFLILSLIFTFALQIFLINSNELLIQNLMTHQQHFSQGNFYSIFTSVFLHANILHILSNLIALLVFGRIVERYMDYKVLFIFIASGIIANIISNYISYLQGDMFYSLGASGAIAGLIMFAIILSPFSLTSVLIVPLPIFLFGWLLIISDIIGLTNPSQTNHLAHLGGYSALLLLFFFLEFKERKKIITGFTINLSIMLFIYLIIKIYGIDIFSLV